MHHDSTYLPRGERDIAALDLYAAHAAQGILADPEDLDRLPGLSCEESVAERAFVIALAMLKKRKQIINASTSCGLRT